MAAAHDFSSFSRVCLTLDFPSAACTQLIYSPTPGGSNATDTTVVNSCRFENAGGFFLNGEPPCVELGGAHAHQ